MSSVGTKTAKDDDSSMVPSTENTEVSQASTKAKRARLFITGDERWGTDDLSAKSFVRPSDMFTAISSETLGTIVIPELQALQKLPVVWWDPFRSEEGGFLVAFNRCLKVAHTDDDLRKYTMVAALSKPTLWDKEWVQEKYGSFDIVFNEGIKQALDVALVKAECKRPYDQGLWQPAGRAVGYVLEPTGQSKWRFLCCVVEEF